MSYNEGPDGDSYGGDEDGHKKRDTSRKRDGKKDKKEKGYTMFEEEDSDGDNLVLADDMKSPSKAKGGKAKPFKFPVRKEKGKEKEEKKDKEAKKEVKEKRREEKEGKKLKKEKKKNKLNLQSPAVTIAAPGDYENPIFGVPLAVSVERNKSHDGIELPAIVRECVDYIEECGLSCEGIYRISGVKSKVQALKDSYNRHQSIYLYEHEPNIVASLLKQFLRDLPEPVLTTVMMPKFEEASTAKSNKKKVELFSKLIQELPACNRLLLSWMIVHMSHVIDLAKENKMTLQNVSIVLSPTMRISHRVLNVLFSNTHQLFADVQLRKYVPPLRPAHSKWSLELPDSLTSLQEELAKQESLLNQLHTDLNSGLTDPVIEEQLWEVQRVVTQLKRKIKLAKKDTEKTEGPRPSADPKMSSSSSLPSLSAPEELRLDLKPLPPPEETTPHSDTAVETKADVEPPQPVVGPTEKEGRRENTMTLENSKTVKFAEEPLAKKKIEMETERKDETEKKDETESKDETNRTDEETEKVEKKKKDETENVEAEDKEAVEEAVSEAGTEPQGQGEPDEKVNDDVKLNKEDAAKKTELVEERNTTQDDENVKEKVKTEVEKTDSKCKQENKVETEKDEVFEEPEQDEKEEEKQTPKDVREETEVTPQGPEKEKVTKTSSGGDKQQTEAESDEAGVKRTDKAEDEEVEIKKDVKNKREKGKVDDRNKDNPPSLERRTESKKQQQQPVPVPPFMSLTLLEPVKAETPARRQSEMEAVSGREDDGKLEEWKELEDELLGKKKSKASSKKIRDDDEAEAEDDDDNDVSLEQLLEDEYALVMEEEELTAIADELRQKMATERSEMERLAQEIQELHYLRQDSDLEDMSSDSNSSEESEDEDDLQDLLSQIIRENQDLETQNGEMCQKIHEERMICLSVKLQIRLLQQKQLEASCG